MTTLLEATNAFLANVSKSRSALTHKAYRNVFLSPTNGFLPHIRKFVKYDDPIEKLTEKHAMTYMQEILDLAPATRQLHAAAIRRFYTFVAGNDWGTVSIDRLNFLLEGANVLSPVHNQITYDKANVKAFLDAVYAWSPNGKPIQSVIKKEETSPKPKRKHNVTPTRHLRNLRDRAFILTLAESGLRVHEACKMKIKDLNFEKESGVVIGKGNKQARFKIGSKALEAIKCYLNERQTFIPVEPVQVVFGRHDRKSPKDKIIPISPQTGEAIVHLLEMKFLGTRGLTCHTLRHRFVTRLLEVNHNLKAAQLLARHTNINVTERYAHLIDDEIDDSFNGAINETEATK